MEKDKFEHFSKIIEQLELKVSIRRSVKEVGKFVFEMDGNRCCRALSADEAQAFIIGFTMGRKTS